ncbi:hypothetical protein [Kutzneria kofuensis]|uniref:Putative DNA-binding transcriptional regulator AlpA n=1 Tax=Kutzneria kofuensis TaxID=103725 RepID=A0A7W9NHQ0_9PSEU|nr:hypothetical protein [Kutzneria kofuensis]MBB5892779.1 putative DNA-binding transcriptional regulator AlpA [Kutzneria kofuensis]
MTEFELIFAVDQLTDDAIDAIYDRYDALVAGHGDMTLLTVTAEGPTPVAAGKTAVRDLELLAGVIVQRCYEDLVNRKDIAERCNVSPQAVGLWIRGDRQRKHPFPQPFNLVGGGVWLWGEVNEWLRRTYKPQDDVHYPCRDDYAEINRWIAEHRAQKRMLHVDFSWSSQTQVAAGAVAAIPPHIERPNETPFEPGGDWVTIERRTERVGYR